MKLLLRSIIFLALCASDITSNAQSKRTIIISEIPDKGLADYFRFYKSTNKDYKDSLRLIVSNVAKVAIENDKKIITRPVRSNRVAWNFAHAKPVLVNLPYVGGAFYVFPGDSINIKFINDIAQISGRGSIAFQTQYAIIKQGYEGVETQTDYLFNKSLADYLNWDRYCDNRTKFVLQQLRQIKGQVAEELFQLIKHKAIKEIEHSRVEALFTLWNNVLESNGKILSRTNLQTVIDSTLNKPASKWLNSRYNFIGDNSLNYYSQRCMLDVWTRNTNSEALNTKAKIYLAYYNEADKSYRGWVREKLLQYFLSSYVIKKLGYKHHLSKVLLRRYYDSPGFPEHKVWMRDFEKKVAVVKYNTSDDKEAVSLDFELKDRAGRLFTNKDLKGQIALLYFTGPKDQLKEDMIKALNNVRKAFKDDHQVAIVEISTEKEKNKWLKTTKHANFIQLYTGGQGTAHAMLRDYDVKGYPDLMMLGVSSEISAHPGKTIINDSGKHLIGLMRKKISQQNDGPYVSHLNDTVKVQSIIRSKPFTKKILKSNKITLTVNTDEYPKTFEVNLKKQLDKEACIYPDNAKQLALSDIEGNFDQFRKLLQANGVIDADYNWTFGKGHLVLVGDFFDRGEQVTEVLWLIYALEDKANAAGGHVHFILGNHEILNLSGDTRYVREKYLHNANLLWVPYKEQYGMYTELGRWLRTKNIAEQIGQVLYTHGGFDKTVNNLKWDLKQINDAVRPNLDKRDSLKQNKNTPELATLFSSTTSPFWYRGYYENKRVNPAQIDSTLQKFSVKHIVTGHTIVADTVSMHYDGKVFNTDVHHAEGRSEALLIEGDKFYRVNDQGQRWLLLDESKKTIAPKPKEH